MQSGKRSAPYSPFWANEKPGFLRRIFFILILTAIAVSCVERTDLEQGESQATEILDTYYVNSIKFDNSGSAWIGTSQKGLVRYTKGTMEFLNVQYPDLPSTILDIQTDSKGNMWLGYDKGIIEYNGTTFIKYNSSNTPVPDNPVNSIAVDQNDNIWFTSCVSGNGGVVKFDGTSWTVYTPENSALPVNNVRSIAVDGNNNVWLALTQEVNNPYLVKISGNTWKVFDKANFGFTPACFTKIAVNGDNEIFCGIDYSLAGSSGNSGAGLLKYNGITFEKIDIDDNFIVKSMKIDKSDKIWCGDGSGKNQYGVYYGQTWVYNEAGLTESVVTAIDQAADGKIWLGTESGIHIVPNSSVISTRVFR